MTHICTKEYKRHKNRKQTQQTWKRVSSNSVLSSWRKMRYKYCMKSGSLTPKIAVSGLGSITLPIMSEKVWKIFCQYITILGQCQNIWANEAGDWPHLSHAEFKFGYILQSFTFDIYSRWSTLNCKSPCLAQSEEECTFFKSPVQSSSVMTVPRSFIQAVFRWSKEVAPFCHRIQ